MRDRTSPTFYNLERAVFKLYELEIDLAEFFFLEQRICPIWAGAFSAMCHNAGAFHFRLRGSLRGKRDLVPVAALVRSAYRALWNTPETFHVFFFP